MNKLLLPYDVYERHRKVGSLIDSGAEVLDIGGELNHLSQFCHAKKIVVANLNTGDIIIKKNELPFQDNSFSVVCSIDVLEHIPKTQRKKFIDDAIKIASKKIILSFPIYTPKHENYENTLRNWLMGKNIDVSYLNEHIKNGLPKAEEVKLLIKNNYKITYSGYLDINKLLFKIFIFDPKIKLIRKCVYYSKLIFNLITNPIFYLVLSNRNYSQNVNRAYIVVNKKK